MPQEMDVTTNGQRTFCLGNRGNTVVIDVLELDGVKKVTCSDLEIEEAQQVHAYLAVAIQRAQEKDTISVTREDLRLAVAALGEVKSDEMTLPAYERLRRALGILGEGA